MAKDDYSVKPAALGSGMAAGAAKKLSGRAAQLAAQEAAAMGTAPKPVENSWGPGVKRNN